MGIKCLTNDVVLGLAEEQRLGKTGFAVEDRSEGKELGSDLALYLMGLAGIFDAQIGADPANIAHGSIHPLDVELVLEADGETVEWPGGPAVLGVVSIELLSSL